MNRINVGIIGCGRIADLHYLGYRNNREARIYAVCDTSEETVKSRKTQWKAEKMYTDYRDLLADPKVHAVEILTPHHLHEPMVIAAAAAKKHVAVQKPMTTTLASADLMIAAAKSAGIVYKVTDNYVWYPPTLLAKKMIENGEIGTPVNLKIKLIVGGSGGWKVPASSWAWRMKEFEQGLPEETFDHGHHLWATSWFLMGESERVVAWIDSVDGTVDSPSVVMWKYKEGKRYGVLENVCANQMHIPSKYYTNDEWIEITGTHGIITINRCNGNIRPGPPVSFFNGRKWRHYNVKSDWAEGFMGATRNFIGSIQGREQPRLSGEQGREILKFALAALRSSKLRREVYLDEMDAPVPWLVYRKKRAREMKAKRRGRSIMQVLGLGRGTARYAGRARQLTESLSGRFNPEPVKNWECLIGLLLLAEGGSPETKYGISIKGGLMKIDEGSLPANAVFTVKVPAGTWAAILLGKEGIENAFVQGKLVVEGKAEEALKLRIAIGI